MGEAGKKSRNEIYGSYGKASRCFCLFDSGYTDFKATNTKCGRDLIQEYVEAVRAEGLKVGLYYSLLDWHHEDYPHFSDGAHPMYQNPAYPDEGRVWERYVEYLHNQVRELCLSLIHI